MTLIQRECDMSVNDEVKIPLQMTFHVSQTSGDNTSPMRICILVNGGVFFVFIVHLFYFLFNSKVEAAREIQSRLGTQSTRFNQKSEVSEAI